MEDFDIKIKYKNKYITLSAHQSFIMVSDNKGNWFSRDESRLSQHYKQVLDSYDRNSLPTSFNITAETNESIKKLSNDTSYFNELIKKNNSIKISTGDGYWEKVFNLPNGKQYTNKKVYFTSKATYDSYVNYGGKEIKIATNENKLFISDKNGIWSVANLTSENNLDFSKPELFNIKISNNEEILKISKNIDYFNKTIIENDNISISTSDGNWSKNFTLESNPKFAHKKIHFSSLASYNSYIYYGDNKITIEKNQSKTFVADEFGCWRTYENEPLINNINEEIQYIEDGWSIAIPENYIQPGIKLKFTHDNKQGSLSKINIGAPSTLLLHTIDIGMLTPYRGKLTFQNNPELQRQYLQQVPVSRLIVSKYMPVKFDEVVLSNGTHYTTKSVDNGGGHSGDMREEIAKNLVSDGINLANYGINSSAPSENNFLPTSQIIILLDTIKMEFKYMVGLAEPVKQLSIILLETNLAMNLVITFN